MPFIIQTFLPRFFDPRNVKPITILNLRPGSGQRPPNLQPTPDPSIIASMDGVPF